MKALIPVLFVTCQLLSGCIAWEIRDEMRVANAQMCDANTQLTDANASLVKTIKTMSEADQSIRQASTQLTTVQETLAQTNKQLEVVHAQLQHTTDQILAVDNSLGQTQPKLSTLDSDLARMRILDDVHNSLKDINKALGPLSKSMGLVSSAASMFGIGGEADLLEKEGAPQADSGAGAAPASPAPAAADGATGTDAPQPGAKQDLLVGTWMLAYPPAEPPQKYGRILIMSANGTFIESVPGSPLRQGAWSRTKRSLTMKLDPLPPEKQAPPAPEKQAPVKQGANKPEGQPPTGQPGQPATGQPPPPPEEVTVELITLTSRTLTLRRGEDIKVYTRP